MEFYDNLIAFLIFVNCIFLLPFALEVPQLAIIIIRVLGGTCLVLLEVINRGFNLYDDLTPEELEQGQDSKFLYNLRIMNLSILVLAFFYVFIACFCLCCVFGLDGRYDPLRRREALQVLKRVPFGSLLFEEGLDCAICLEAFQENIRVCQLACHPTHCFHRSCLTEWIESGNTTCPLCRVEIRQN